MEQLFWLGKMIKEKRLAQNLRMDDVARKAGISRVTLWSIEKGEGNCSLSSLLRVMDVLGLRMTVENQSSLENERVRATRANTVLSKKINRFIIMCVEQYALFSGSRSDVIYKEMERKGILDELESDYEDLHGMSAVYLNDYLKARMGGSL
ncbi:MAG: helix-turn-helix domain-containing protein [Spirochaetales bacterium]|nr:helix-turn-helix domain-containing protein [Spirochaetales bacterium]